MMRSVLDLIPMSFAIAPVAFGLTNAFFATFGEGLLKTLTVDELVNGYKFPLYDVMNTALIKPLEALGVPLPPERLPESKFGLFHAKNHTNKGGPFGIYTGVTGPKQFLRYVSYRGKT